MLLLLVVVNVLLVARANAVAVQNGTTFPNADFYVTFYSYNITGFMTVVSFVPGAVCSIDVNSIAGPGNISVVLWQDAGNAGCTFTINCFNTLINNIGRLENPPTLNTLIFLAVDSGSTEYSDNWQASTEMLASGILFTSVRNDVWSQFSLDLPLTLTPGWNIWQANYLSSGNRAYLVILAVIWGLLCVSFLATLIDYAVAMFAVQKLVLNLATELNAFGFVFSGIIFGLSVGRAASAFNDQLFFAIYPILLFSFIDLSFGFAVLAFKWLSLCRDTKSLSEYFVKITNVILVVLMVIANIDVILLGVYLIPGTNLPSNQHSVIYILAAVLIIVIAAFVVIVSVSFGKIWGALNLDSDFHQSNRHRRVWKLAILSIGSVVSLLVIILLFVILILAVDTVSVSVALDCMIFLCEIPIIVSWLSLSGLWTRVFRFKTVHGSSTGSSNHQGKESSEGLEKKRHTIVDDDHDDGFLKRAKSSQLYEIGDLKVDM